MDGEHGAGVKLLYPFPENWNNLHLDFKLFTLIR